MTEARKEPSRTEPPRKPYRVPRLQTLGTMRALTRSLAMGLSDGMGGAGMSNTNA